MNLNDSYVLIFLFFTSGFLKADSSNFIDICFNLLLKPLWLFI